MSLSSPSPLLLLLFPPLLLPPDGPHVGPPFVVAAGSAGIDPGVVGGGHLKKKQRKLPLKVNKLIISHACVLQFIKCVLCNCCYTNVKPSDCKCDTKKHISEKTT